MKHTTKAGALDRYLKILDYMAHVKHFKLTATIKRFKVNNSLGVILQKHGYITKTTNGYYYHWSNDNPTPGMAEKILRLTSDYTSKSNVKQMALPLHKNGSCSEAEAILLLKRSGKYRIFKMQEVEL